jgi:hypothetical protein
VIAMLVLIEVPQCLWLKRCTPYNIPEWPFCLLKSTKTQRVNYCIVCVYLIWYLKPHLVLSILHLVSVLLQSLLLTLWCIYKEHCGRSFLKDTLL